MAASSLSEKFLKRVLGRDLSWLPKLLGPFPVFTGKDCSLTKFANGTHTHTHTHTHTLTVSWRSELNCKSGSLNIVPCGLGLTPVSNLGASDQPPKGAIARSGAEPELCFDYLGVTSSFWFLLFSFISAPNSFFPALTLIS